MVITDIEFNNLLQKISQKYFDGFVTRSRTAFYPEIIIHPFSTDIDRYQDEGINSQIGSDISRRKEWMLECGREMWKSQVQIAVVFMVFESWKKSFRPDQTKSSRPLSEYIDKVETFMVIGQTIDQRSNSVLWEMERGKKNRILLKNPEVHLYEDDSKFKFQNNLIDMFYAGYLENQMRRLNIQI